MADEKRLALARVQTAIAQGGTISAEEMAAFAEYLSECLEQARSLNDTERDELRSGIRSVVRILGLARARTRLATDDDLPSA